MLNLFDNKKTYHDDFVYYLDRNKNLNVIFSFNFYKFILDNVRDSSIVFATNNRSNYEIKVFLTRDEEFKNYIELFDSVQKIQISNTNFLLDTFFCTKNVARLSGNYKILVRISYGQLKHEFIDYQLPSTIIYDKSKYNNLKYEKIINETKYAFFEQKSSNLDNQYMFESDNIEIDFNKKCISNLYEIYYNNITYNNLFNYLSSLEESRGIKFDGTLTTNGYIDQDIRKLDFNFLNNSGSKINYYNLATKIFQNTKDQIDYKTINYANNIFLLDKTVNTSRKATIQSYEKLADSLTSTACDNNLFNDKIESIGIGAESDILLLSFVYDNINNLDINSFWKDDLTLLPVYIFDVKTRYKIYYISSLNSDSMTQNWSLLDKQTLENLSGGNYLCKIVNDEMYLTDLLIENCFILNK